MKKILILLIIVLSFSWSYANNIQISKTILTGQNLSSQTYQIQFDISWENSWRTSTLESNWDAAWVFVKYRIPNITNWQHIRVEPAGFVAPVGANIEPSSDGMGAFIYRNVDGIGHVDWDGVQLQWNYGNAGIGDNEEVEICVFAIEMVYVPQGAFWVGDGTTTDIYGHFSADFDNPYQISSEAAIQLGGNIVTEPSNLKSFNGTGMFEPDDFDLFNIVLLPAAFPKGFDAFYIMKYEGSQAQYAAFLNNLTLAQATNRYASSTGNLQDSGAGENPYVSNTPYHPCYPMTFETVVAYVDWAGLRVPTEFEWEKAARGTRAPVTGEFAWGNASFNAIPYNIVNQDQANEYISNPNVGQANAKFGGTGATEMVRCGIFAASAVNKTRVETGASYYGVMEMSGNAAEYVIGIGTPDARIYTGFHGDGALTSNGDPNILSYPNATSSIKFGAFIQGAGAHTTISSRQGMNDFLYDAYTPVFMHSDMDLYATFRAVRTAD